jgi:hypothetical protein
MQPTRHVCDQFGADAFRHGWSAIEPFGDYQNGAPCVWIIAAP